MHPVILPEAATEPFTAHAAGDAPSVRRGSTNDCQHFPRAVALGCDA
jgi:hypothetical protein